MSVRLSMTGARLGVLCLSFLALGACSTAGSGGISARDFGEEDWAISASFAISPTAIAPRAPIETAPRKERLRRAGAACAPGLSAALLSANRLSASHTVALASRGDILMVAGLAHAPSRAFKIDQSGMLRLPGLAPIRAHGQTLGEIGDNISAHAPDGPSIHVERVEAAPVRIQVVGAVARPGGFHIDLRSDRSGGTTRSLVTAIAAAGGATLRADLDNVLVGRGGALYRLSYADAVSGGWAASIPIISGDVIYVPQKDCLRAI